MISAFQKRINELENKLSDLDKKRKEFSGQIIDLTSQLGYKESLLKSSEGRRKDIERRYNEMCAKSKIPQLEVFDPEEEVNKDIKYMMTNKPNSNKGGDITENAYYEMKKMVKDRSRSKAKESVETLQAIGFDVKAIETKNGIIIKSGN